MRKKRCPAIIIFFLATLFWQGCGGGSPPVSINAPVGSLMTASDPDANGVVTVMGSNGAVTANAAVILTNPPAIAKSWFNRWIKAAFAQASPVCVMANGSGAFTGQIFAQAGETIGVQDCTSCSGGTCSPTTVIHPPCNPCAENNLCTDTLDNDNDTLIDCADPDCSAAPSCGGACSPVAPTPGNGTVPFGGACDDDADCAGGLPCVSCQCV